MGVVGRLVVGFGLIAASVVLAVAGPPAEGGEPPVSAWYGTAGEDFYLGSEARDIASGYGGYDEIWGRGGDDVLGGGLGDDDLEGDGGADSLLGGPGNDELDAGAGHDYLDGGEGRDFLTSWSGRETMRAGADDDQILLVADFAAPFADDAYARADTIDCGPGYDVVTTVGTALQTDPMDKFVGCEKLTVVAR